MYKKIINPKDELHYNLNSVDTRYILNEGDRAIGFFAATKEISVPTQISPGDVCFYVIEGIVKISIEDKIFEVKSSEMILVPKTNAYDISFLEDSKVIFTRI